MIISSYYPGLSPSNLDAILKEVDPDAPEPAEGEEPKMKTVAKTSTDWELMNSQKPIWLRPPKEVR